jgi:hypothetical protein
MFWVFVSDIAQIGGLRVHRREAAGKVIALAAQRSENCRLRNGCEHKPGSCYICSILEDQLVSIIGVFEGVGSFGRVCRYGQAVPDIDCSVGEEFVPLL